MPSNSSENIASIKNSIEFLSEKVDEPMHAKKEISQSIKQVYFQINMYKNE